MYIWSCCTQADSLLAAFHDSLCAIFKLTLTPLTKTGFRSPVLSGWPSCSSSSSSLSSMSWSSSHRHHCQHYCHHHHHHHHHHDNSEDDEGAAAAADDDDCMFQCSNCGKPFSISQLENFQSMSMCVFCRLQNPEQTWLSFKDDPDV